MDEDEHREQWDLISLSLVVNFVPEPKDRGQYACDIQYASGSHGTHSGRMLRLAHTMLKPDQYLFLAVSLSPVYLSSQLTPSPIA